MALNVTIEKVTNRIISRSSTLRTAYLERMRRAKPDGPARAHLSCGTQAHAYAGAGPDQNMLAAGSTGNVGIITAYNDMLSAHQPYQHFPDIIRQAAREFGGTAQVAGGVPAMCDGVTQGNPGMEMSLFSRDVIAMATAIALSHDTYDSALYLGVCDKIVPGLVIAAQTFGHLPAIFVPAGPMPSGLSNDEKSKTRMLFADGKIDKAALLKSEMTAYHAPGTCTFYGTANTNQMLMEIMGLHLPGASFVNPYTDLRDALTRHASKRALEMTAFSGDYSPICDILDERAFVNGIVGLNATGGSTNLLIHLIAMARAGGILLDWQDFSDISAVTPLITRIYPNGLADINQFQAAGGMASLIGNLLYAGLLHADANTIAKAGLSDYTKTPTMSGENVIWCDAPSSEANPSIIRSVEDPFQSTGGLIRLSGNIGNAVMKISAVVPDLHFVEAPVQVFHEQEAVKAAFKAGKFTTDTIIVLRFQGPKANGMPELHSLTPLLSILLGRGLNIAFVTDGRMSGASGKVPSAIHVSPEALDGGPIAKLKDGDVIRLDAKAGSIEVLDQSVLSRPPALADLNANNSGMGRELFANFRALATSAETGASSLYQDIDAK